MILGVFYSLLPIFYILHNLPSSSGLLAKNYSRRFCEALLLPPFVALFTLLSQWTTQGTLPKLPAFLQMLSTHSLCMTAIPHVTAGAGVSHQPQKGIASHCKCFCHLLHWRLHPCQCPRQGIASDCSKYHEVNALSPEGNAPLTPGCIFNRAWALVTLCQNYNELAVMTWNTFVSHISCRVFPNHFKMTIMQPEWVANRLFYPIAATGGFLHETLWLGRTRRALAKRKPGKWGWWWWWWVCVCYGKSLIAQPWVLKEYTNCQFLLEKDNTQTGIFTSIFDALALLLEIKWWMQLTCSWLLWLSFSL